MTPTTAPDVQPGATDDGFPPAVHAWGVVLVLAIVSTFAFLDRQLIYLLIDPMRKSLGVSDSQLSLIQGLAFVLFYTLMGLPLGRLVDRYNRRYLMMAGIVVWSIMTIACGLANDFWTLFAARAGVGVGEAILMPAAFSLIADYFRPTSRGRPYGIIGMCSGLGSGLSFIIGSAVLKAIPGDSTVHIPVLGELMGWQMAFVLAGAPGLLVCLLMLLVREPKRRELATADYKHAPAWPLLKRHVGGNWLAFLAVFGAGGMLALVAYAVSAWTAAYFIRHFGMPAPTVGVLVGLTVIFSGVIQGPLSGVIGDILAKRKVGGRILITASCVALAIPFAIAWPLAAAPMLALALLVIANTLGNTALLATPAMIQELAPNEIRGFLLACSSVVQGVLGAGIGPISVALFTDYVYRNDKMLGASIASVAIPAYLGALILGLIGIRAYARARQATIALVGDAPITTTASH